ncbi:hypothetical protein M885DRAFT_590866 [Pelagophyceae sp. CCMP2097]|nr:hypothetical protein M885DRAFT_590866 [Pelagophyceae sp. CCMP2097]
MRFKQVLVAALVAARCDGLSPAPRTAAAPQVAAAAGRRAVLGSALAGFAVFSGVSARAADLDDLSAPSAPAPPGSRAAQRPIGRGGPAFFLRRTAEEDEAARVKRKVAMQSQAGVKEKSGRETYSEGFKAEVEKEKSIKGKTKKQQRDDLCEMLGRGC